MSAFIRSQLLDAVDHSEGQHPEEFDLQFIKPTIKLTQAWEEPLEHYQHAGLEPRAGHTEHKTQQGYVLLLPQHGGWEVVQ